MPQPINPTYIIGLGGTGRLAVVLIKKVMCTYYLKSGDIFPLVKFLTVDTEYLSDDGSRPDKKEKEVEEGDFRYEAEMAELGSQLKEDEKFQLTVTPSETNSAIQRPQDLGIEDFIDTEALGGQPGTIIAGAGGVGVVAKIALVRKYNEFKNKVESDIKDLITKDRVNDLLTTYGYSERYCWNMTEVTSPNVIIICSLGGGTGKGIFIPVAATIRKILLRISEKHNDHATIQLFNFLPACFQTEGRRVPEGSFNYIQSNQYAAFKELDYLLTPNVGYLPEAFIRRGFGSQNDNQGGNTPIMNLYNLVFNLSPMQGTRGTVGKYETVNNILANYVAMTTFDGQQNDIQTDLRSNLSQHVLNNPYQEAGTGLLRNRCYGMIGHYSLKYPVEKMFRWAQHFYIMELLLDMVNGKLVHKEQHPEANQIEKAEWKRHAEERADQDAKEVLKKIKNIYTKVDPIKLSQIECKDVQDNWKDKIHNKIATLLKTVESNFKIIREEHIPLREKTEQRGSNLFTNAVGELQGTCVGLIKVYGMEYCRRYLRCYLSEIYESLAKEELEHTSPDAETEKKEDKTESPLPRLMTWLESSTKGLEQEIKDWKNDRCAHYQTIDDAVEDYKKRLKDDKSLLSKAWEAMTFSETIPKLDRSTEGKIQKTLDTFNAFFKKYQGLLRETFFVEFLTKLEAEIEKMISILSINITIIDGKRNGEDKEKGLAKDLESEMRRIEMEAEETPCILVHGGHREELRSFATDDIPGQISIYKIASDSLNKEGGAVERLLFETVNKEELRKSIEEVTKQIDSIKGKFSITGYLAKLGEDQNPESKKRMNRYFEQLFDGADYLGMLDESVIKDGNPVHMEKAFLYVHKQERIQRFVEVTGSRNVSWKSPAGSGMPALEQRNVEEIILSKTMVAIGLFLFRELYQCSDRYLQALVEGKIGATDINRNQFLARYHTGKQYFDIPEPFGSGIQVADAERNAFLNLLFHTGTIRLSKRLPDSQCIEIIKFPHSDYDNPDDYRLLKNEQVAKQLEQRVFFTELKARLNQMPQVLALLIEKLIERLVRLGKIKPDILEKYFGNNCETYPLFPRFVYRELAKRSAIEKELLRLFDRHAKEYEREYDERLKERQEMEICETLDALKKRFAAPPLEVFKRVAGVRDEMAQAGPAAQPSPSSSFMTCRTEDCPNKGKDLGNAKFCPECGNPTAPIGGGGDFLTCHTEGCKNKGEDLGTAKFCPECGKPTAQAGAGGGFQTCLTEGCPNRGKDLGTARFCGECGKATGPAS